MIKRLFISGIVLFLALSSSGYANDKNSFIIKLADKGNASISNPYDTLWKYTVNSNTWSISNSSQGDIVFKKDYDTLAEGKFKGDKLTIIASDDKLYLKIKITPDKIKVSQDNTLDVWELKQKKNKIKAKLNGTKHGSIKFYPETGKIKVKDRFNKVIAEIKAFERISYAPGAFLMKDLSNDQQIFVALFLFLKGL